uniref:Uncharacterized protein n=1 Tax=Spumella elongata TaxID=89044 RepID=A0A7S3GY27_9STRA|mmetsp:Transcript_25166/g.43346  ORF Transcript_25166/g.43346 Transcript_25166/m.43346 type:complete len:384 (+) Transcript_25166:75-1226(+)|eukprot:CAMPEP_0184992924 /NCGR_PEP_ID=MMETSP1098-20130426/43198_1 /TAXON_ID=89044 /ORGANISM="Spumella elongata, Strain CCAP 955/1" /LENGTH=383 /DNA_ID=CAMNT_0027518655 /DNA_START=70 /DNA_END=1221 /DNA_ORIENTATION=-
MPRSKAVIKAEEEDEPDANFGKNDKRKFNRGASQRRSYTKEEKLSVINMKDSGMSYDDISKQTGFSRVNMEKWCSVKGREAIATKASKASIHEKPAQIAEEVPLKKPKGVVEQAPSATLAPAIVTAPPPPLKKSNSNEVSSSSSAVQRQNQAPARGQSIPPGAADTFSSSGEENGDDGSDEECEDMNSDPHLLRLVMKEQRQIKQEQKESQGQTGPPTTNKRKLRGDVAPAPLPPPETGYFPHQHKLDPVSAIVPKHILDKELVRVHHTNFASNITMSISDTMLKPDFSALSGQNSRNIDMSTTQQATRQVLSNTKFFKMLHEGRKKQQKIEGQKQEESIESSVEPAKKTEKLKTKRRVLEILCDSDSDQEKEDSRMLMLLGE